MPFIYFCLASATGTTNTKGQTPATASTNTANTSATNPANSSANSSSTAKTSSAQSTPPANSEGMVWVNTDSGIYHKPGTRYYGKTKQGKYMTEADAQKAGYRASEKN